MVLIGGSAVGTFYARMGAAVTIVQRAGRLIDREDPRVGALADQAPAADGVTVRTGRTVTRARQCAAGTVVTLDGVPAGEAECVPQWLTANVRAGGPPPNNESLNLDLARLDLSCLGTEAEPRRTRAAARALGQPLWASRPSHDDSA